jgi:trans-2-enoyl-CoA reductase
MTARLQANELQKKAIQERVKKTVSQYSEALRRRIGDAADFKEEFNAVFDGYVENLIPNEDIMEQL